MTISPQNLSKIDIQTKICYNSQVIYFNFQDAHSVLSLLDFYVPEFKFPNPSNFHSFWYLTIRSTFDAFHSLYKGGFSPGYFLKLF